jgi:GTPase SAR1 family protein
LKIAFIGSHGVGKTTLCYDLAARLKRLDLNVDMVKEVARECPLPINRETTLESQAWIIHSQIAEEIAVSTKYEAVVCDRSVLDDYAYLVHKFGRRPEYDLLVGEWVRTYTALFKVPILHPPTYDGTRDVSETYQAEIDEVFDDLVEVLDIPCYQLDPADRDSWVDFVLRTMGLPLHPPQIDLFVAES